MAPPRPIKNAPSPTSTKKLAKVARSGKKRSVRDSSSRGYPLAILAICVVGALLVFWGRDQRASAQRVQPTLSDHWHIAYGMYLCDAFAPNPVDKLGDEVGVHTHDDGIIHVHPFSSLAAGDKAKIGLFFNEIGLDITDTKLTTTDGTSYESGKTTCPSGEVGTLALLSWARADDQTAAPEVITRDFAGARFRNDRMAFTLAFVPESKLAEVPRPQSIPNLDQLTDIDPALLTTLPPTPGTTAVGTATTAVGASTTSAATGATTAASAETTTAPSTTAG